MIAPKPRLKHTNEIELMSFLHPHSLRRSARKSFVYDQLIYSRLCDILDRVEKIQVIGLGLHQNEPRQLYDSIASAIVEMDDWFSGLPSNWVHTIHICAPDMNFYAPYYYAYTTYDTAVTMIEYRAFRCVANEYLLSILSKHPDDLERYKEQEDSIKSDIQTLAMDICASVPFFTGRVYNEFPRVGAGTMQLLWPLFVCARMECLPEEQRDWCIRQLDFLANVCGFNLGHKAATIARQSKQQSLDVMTPEFRTLWKECVVFASW